MVTDENFLFPLPPVASLPIRGERRRFPVRRIFCVGRNYAAHAAEMGGRADKDEPFYFTKSAAHLIGSGTTIAYPPGTANLHHEIELVAALGAPAFELRADQVPAVVFGYACGLDLTRRDLQNRARDAGRPWDLGKDFEDAAVVSEIVPASVIGHPARGEITLAVNGAMRQKGDIGDMVNSVTELLVHLSRFYHLDAGDLLFTGTPSGVGPVVAGDRLEGAVEGVGRIALDVRT